jgi:hypothetical protein
MHQRVNCQIVHFGSLADHLPMNLTLRWYIDHSIAKQPG